MDNVKVFCEPGDATRAEINGLEFYWDHGRQAWLRLGDYGCLSTITERTAKQLGAKFYRYEKATPPRTELVLPEQFSELRYWLGGVRIDLKNVGDGPAKVTIEVAR